MINTLSNYVTASATAFHKTNNLNFFKSFTMENTNKPVENPEHKTDSNKKPNDQSFYYDESYDQCQHLDTVISRDSYEVCNDCGAYLGELL